MNINTIGAGSNTNGVHSQNVNPSNNTNAAAMSRAEIVRRQLAVESPLKYALPSENLAGYKEQFTNILSNVRSDNNDVAFRARRDVYRLLANLRDNGYMSITDANNAAAALLGFSPGQVLGFSYGGSVILKGGPVFSQEAWDNTRYFRDFGEKNFKTLDQIINLRPGIVPDYLAERYDEETIQSFFRIANIFNQIFNVNGAVIDSMGENKSSAD